MTFTGQCGHVRSTAGNIVAGYGSSIVRNQKSLTAGMFAQSSLSPAHFFVFTLTSVTFIRALSRAKKFITTFRTLE